jgi:hypothetical protein
LTGPARKCASVDSWIGPAPMHALIGRWVWRCAQRYSSAIRTGPRRISPSTATPPAWSSAHTSRPRALSCAGCGSFSAENPWVRSSQYHRNDPIPMW